MRTLPSQKCLQYPTLLFQKFLNFVPPKLSKGAKSPYISTTFAIDIGYPHTIYRCKAYLVTFMWLTISDYIVSWSEIPFKFIIPNCPRKYTRLLHERNPNFLVGVLNLVNSEFVGLITSLSTTFMLGPTANYTIFLESNLFLNDYFSRSTLPPLSPPSNRGYISL